MVTSPSKAWKPSGLMTVAAALLIAGVTARPAQGLKVRLRVPVPPSPQPAQVAVDVELTTILDRAATQLKDKDYESAVKVLQFLLETPNTGFDRTTDKQRYVSVAEKARRLLGSMDAEGLAVYRRHYGPTARRLYERGLAEGDEAALWQVARRYQHTRSGPLALAMLGAMHFDRGQFGQAACRWRRAAALSGQDRAPVLLAKQAVAWHLAGRTEAADAVAAQLAKRFGRSVAVLGGRRQNVVEFVASVRRSLSPRPAGSARPKAEWHGPTGSANGQAVMGKCGAVTGLHWRTPRDVTRAAADARSAMIVLRRWVTHQNRSGSTASVRLDGGHLTALQTTRGQAGTKSDLPPTIHPIIVDNTVIYRDDQHVVAYKLGADWPEGERGGKLAWQTVPLPIYPPQAARYQYPYHGQLRALPDAGRYAVTTDGRRAYVLAGHRPRVTIRPKPAPQPVPARNPPSWKGLYATRALVAVSIRKKGRLVWAVGDGAGETDVIRRGRFLSAPTVLHRRLYTAVALGNTLYEVCLAAETGRLIWQAEICELPGGLDRLRLAYPHIWPLGVSTGAAGGKVFVCTNIGVIAAFDADSGVPVWAFQYTSPADRRPAAARRLASAVNPVIVTADRLICLPADSPSLLALSGEDGRLLWRLAGTQSDLSAVDADRVVISSPGLSVVDVRTGKAIHTRTDAGILGRPAVGPQAVLASGRGKLLRLDLRDYTWTDVPLAAGTILGNLVTVDGMLVAANAIGTSAYLDYATCRTRLTRLLARQRGPQRTALLIERGRLALNAGRYAAALADLVPAAKEAVDNGAGDRATEVRALLVRAHVARGNRAASPDEMTRHFERAMAAAIDVRDRARMLVRIAQCHELRARQWTAAKEAALVARRLQALVDAVDAARTLATTYGGQEVPDLMIGAEAVRAGTDHRRAKLFTARQWATSVFLPKLLADHGRECYAAVDAEAEAGLTRALDDGSAEAMLAVAHRWPNSLHAPRALLKAAETLYRHATAAAAADLKRLDKAETLLTSVAARTAYPRLAVQALAGTAIIQHRRARTMHATLICRRIRRRCQAAKIPLTELVTFDRTPRTLASLLDAFDGGFRPARPDASVGSIPSPLTPAFAITGADVYIVQNSAYRPVHCGSNVLLIKGRRLLWVNTAANDAAKAVLWSAELPMAPSSVTGHVFAKAEWMVGEISGDGKTIAFATGGRVVLLDAKTGKLRLCSLTLPHGIHMLGLAPGTMIAADLRANIACVDLATGKTRWKINSGVAGFSLAPQLRDNVVLMHGNVWRDIVCLDLATGKPVARWKAGGDVRGTLVGEGLIAVLADGKLTLHDLANGNTLIWQRSYGSSAALMGVHDGKLFVTEGTTSRWIDVVAVDGERLGRYAIQPAHGGRTVVAWVRPDGKHLYVGVGSRPSGLRAYLHAGIWKAYWLNVQKIDTTTGKVLWNRFVHRQCPVAIPATVAGPTLVVRARAATTHYVENVYLLNTADGKSVQTLMVIPKTARYDHGGMVRRYAAGPSAILGGRLCAHGPGGVTIYRPKRPPQSTAAKAQKAADPGAAGSNS